MTSIFIQASSAPRINPGGGERGFGEWRIDARDMKILSRAHRLPFAPPEGSRQRGESCVLVSAVVESWLSSFENVERELCYI